MLIGLFGCGPEAPTGGPQREELLNGSVSAQRVSSGIRLENDTREPVAFVVWNRAWLGLIAPCIDTTPNCLRLTAGGRVIVPHAEILGYAPGIAEAIVRFWRVVPDGAGSFRVEDIREITVKF